MSDGNSNSTTEVYDTAGKHRLTLKCGALVWWALEEGKWKERRIISKEEFQGESECSRWVSDLRSIDPATGNAIINVAEGDAPPNSNEIHYIYSWREWSLTNNREVRTISVCDERRPEFASIHFRDARILGVYEQTDQRCLTFLVSYPLTDGETDFRRKRIVFDGCTRYYVSERNLCGGEPTILEATLLEQTRRSMTIQMRTDCGVREVSCFWVSEAEQNPSSEGEDSIA
jgi:hypothetical protein